MPFRQPLFLKLGFAHNQMVAMEGMMMRLQARFPQVRDAHLLQEIEHHGMVLHLNAGEIYLGQGEKVGLLPLLLEGRLKVLLEDTSDRELMLYEVNPGESCAAVWFAIYTENQRMPASILVEEDAEVLVIPKAFAIDWVNRYHDWAALAFQEMRLRMHDVVDVVKHLIFCNNDDRILDHLKKKALTHGTMVLALTHSELARELGTAREVVSRRLKVLEKKGLLQMSRGKIEIHSLQ